MIPVESITASEEKNRTYEWKRMSRAVDNAIEIRWSTLDEWKEGYGELWVGGEWINCSFIFLTRAQSVIWNGRVSYFREARAVCIAAELFLRTTDRSESLNRMNRERWFMRKEDLKLAARAQCKNNWKSRVIEQWGGVKSEWGELSQEEILTNN